jgi:hypothetical protein
MYCSISDAWSQENTMANLAKRFNREYLPNNTPQQMEYFKVNDSIQGNDKNDLYHGNVIQEQKVQQPQTNKIPTINLNTNLVKQKPNSKNDTQVEQPAIVQNHLEILDQHIEPKKTISNKKYSCTELVNKVLSCNKCRNIILQRLNINNTSILDSFNNLFKDTNKEIVILILIGLIIIILLDLFLRIGKSLN